MSPTATDEASEKDDWDKIFAGGATGGGIESIIPKDLSGEDMIRPEEDAIDFEGEDELADDEDDLPEEEEPLARGGEVGQARDLEEAAVDEEEDEDIHIPDFFAHHRGGSLTVNVDGISLAGELDGGHGGFGDAWFDELNEEGHPPEAGTEEGDEDASDLGESEEEGHLHNQIGKSDSDTDPLKLLQTGANLLNKTEAILESELLDEINAIDDKTTNEQLLRAYYPEFRSGVVLKMNTIFGPKPSKLLLPKPKVVRQQFVPVKTRLEVEPDQRKNFKIPAGNQLRQLTPPPELDHVINISSSSVDKALRKTGFFSAESEDRNRSSLIGDDFLVKFGKEIDFAAADWDIFEGEDDDSYNTPESGNGARSSSLSDNGSFKKRHHPGDYGSAAIFESGMYDSNDEEAILEGSFEPSRKKTRLDMNDAHLLFIDETQSRRLYSNNRNGNIGNENSVVRSMVPANENQLQSRYNISNDGAYDMLKENYQSKVRATIGNLNIDHSMVALRLQSPHYKVKLSKAQMRSFHRPSFVVKPNVTIQFSKIKQRKKKKDKGKHITQLLAKTGDLTLGDSAQFFLLEYCEEFPLVLSCFGMGSKLINYYRKKTADDAERPKLPIGETHVLGVQDKSAFWNFGFVERGTVVPTLYNRMVRAPVFKHDSKSTDFLLIRSTGGGVGQKYFLRAIQHLFVVGQTFPVTAIPGPHSRKVTTASKNRLKMVVYRVLNKSEHQRLQVRDISGHFPDQNDMQNRQRLKEFMEYQRSGDDQGFWKVKSGDILPQEETIRSMISPEDIALLESMQVGQQHLEDAGYGKTVEDDQQEDEDRMSIEEQLAPWNISRNFINATQGKAMLQLHGEGDPSGGGEGFSFLRTSMKGGFKAIGESVNDKLGGKASKIGGHSYNVALQQRAYDEEIRRIWFTQSKSLRISDVSELGWDEEEHNRDNPEEQLPSEQPSIANTPYPDSRDDDDLSLFSHNSTTTGQQNKVLRITRLVKDEHGVLQQKVEVVRDPNVIRAYMKRRQMVEDSQLA